MYLSALLSSASYSPTNQSVGSLSSAASDPYPPRSSLVRHQLLELRQLAEHPVAEFGTESIQPTSATVPKAAQAPKSSAQEKTGAEDISLPGAGTVLTGAGLVAAALGIIGLLSLSARRTVARRFEPLLKNTQLQHGLNRFATTVFAHPLALNFAAYTACDITRTLMVMYGTQLGNGPGQLTTQEYAMACAKEIGLASANIVVYWALAVALLPMLGPVARRIAGPKAPIRTVNFLREAMTIFGVAVPYATLGTAVSNFLANNLVHCVASRAIGSLVAPALTQQQREAVAAAA